MHGQEYEYTRLPLGKNPGLSYLLEREINEIYTLCYFSLINTEEPITGHRNLNCFRSPIAENSTQRLSNRSIKDFPSGILF